jgi:hypothetical protein
MFTDEAPVEAQRSDSHELSAETEPVSDRFFDPSLSMVTPKGKALVHSVLDHLQWQEIEMCFGAVFDPPISVQR